MLDTALALLAVKAKTIALVAGTAVVTAGAVGGGSVALQAVSSETPVVQAAAAATPTVTIGIGRKGNGRGAERRSDTATAVLTGQPLKPAVCDPTLNHGQNVSAYARSLPPGPGRGRLVSQFAQSDCGKTAAKVDAGEVDADDAESTKAEKPAKA